MSVKPHAVTINSINKLITEAKDAAPTQKLATYGAVAALFAMLENDPSLKGEDPRNRDLFQVVRLHLPAALGVIEPRYDDVSLHEQHVHDAIEKLRFGLA